MDTQTGQTDGHTDRSDSLTHGQVRQTDGHTDRSDRRMDTPTGQTDRWTHRQVRQTDGQIRQTGQTDGHTDRSDRWTHGQVRQTDGHTDTVIPVQPPKFPTGGVTEDMGWGGQEYATHALFVLIRRRRRSDHRYPSQTRRHSIGAEPGSKQDRTRDPHHADHQPMIVRVRTARPLSLQDCRD